MSIPSSPIRSLKALVLGPVGRFGVALVLTVSAWMIVSGLAIMVFSGQVTWNSHNIVQSEVLGFAYAFSVAGIITGFVAMATFGKWHRALGFVLTGGILLGASLPALRWLIFRFAARNLGWGRRSWDEAFERIGPSLALGVVMALAVSILVLTSRPAARRMAPWQFGLLIATAVSILGIWGFPPMISQMTDRAIPYLRWHYGYRYDEVLQGAAIGSGPGALTGAIVVTLMTRWLGTATSARRLDLTSIHENM